MEVLRPVPKQSLGISLTKGTVPLKDSTTPSTPAGLLLFPGQEGSPLLLQVKKPTSWLFLSFPLSVCGVEIVSHLVVYEVLQLHCSAGEGVATAVKDLLGNLGAIGVRLARPKTGVYILLLLDASFAKERSERKAECNEMEWNEDVVEWTEKWASRLKRGPVVDKWLRSLRIEGRPEVQGVFLLFWLRREGQLWLDV
ncbi:hypothetical protein Taro_035924 [Colocasia esculenta]|uniref:Uncharacterized protein n=1 Tax=Colocasia esculenta TaxID=4460 RepID=A0A843W082_COLES|nr:hypothetical protein [Colocasia esculenta]